MISVLKVSLPDGKTQAASRQNRAVLLGTAIFTVFLAMLASYAIVRYVIVKPLQAPARRQRRASAAATSPCGPTSTRATSSRSWPRPSTACCATLATNQEELRHANANLDVKVDELAQANMRLYEMNRLKSDFLATMSHELRTPLNSIIGFSATCSSSIASLDDKQSRYVKNIQNSGKMLLEMINDILDLAKIESGKMEVRLTDFRIDARRRPPSATWPGR